jgi:hypothetical protein
MPPKLCVLVRDSLAWLLLKVVGALREPTLRDRPTPPTFLHRVNTADGKSSRLVARRKPATQEFVPYTADYMFY